MNCPADQPKIENDAHLSDHEWRLKEAAAGRAYYRPGKTIEEMMAPKKTELQEVTLTIPLDQARKLQEAAGEVPYQLGNAANVFKLLWGLTSSGFAPPEAQLCAIYDLCARGLLSITEKEGDRLDTLDMKLRDALKPFPQEVTE